MAGPGVTVTTSVRVGPAGEGEVVSGQAFFVGETVRGPVDAPVLCRSVADFKTNYGGYATGNLYPHILTFFEEGGTRCYVQRVASASATAGFLDLEDSGAASVTMRVTAKTPGSWSEDLDVEVVAGDAAGTFKIKVYLEDNLEYTSRDLTDVADAIAVINTSGINHLVVASAGANPNVDPGEIAPTALSAGSNGTVLDADYTGALDDIPYELGPGAICMPGKTGSTFWDAVIDHAAANNRIAVLAFAVDDTAAEARTAVVSYYGDTDAEYTAFYYPWVVIPSPVTTGLTLQISPEAYVCAARSRAVQEAGAPWAVGAGLVSEAKYVTNLVDSVSRATGDLMDEKRINTIRKIGTGIRVYGARSVSSDEENWRFITYRDTVNHITYEAELRLEDELFSVIDSRETLFSQVEAILVGLLEPMRQAGGLYEAYDAEGNLVDPGYSVTVNSQNNPVQQLAIGRVHADVGVRVSAVGDKITVNVIKSNLTAPVG